MKTHNNVIFRLRAAGFGLLAAAALTACSEEEFVRDAGELPAAPGKTPAGALYAAGSFDPEMQDFGISEDTEIQVVYRLAYPAKSDIKITLALGDEYDIIKFNDAKGLKDDLNFGPLKLTPYKRYRMLPESNYELPTALTLTVQEGKTESAPLTIKVVYDAALLPSDFGKRMLWPWMLPLKVEKVEGQVVAIEDQMLGIGIRPASMDDDRQRPTEFMPREEKFTFITYCDCRQYDPSSAIFYTYFKAEYIDNGRGGYTMDRNSRRYSPAIDVEILHPAFIVPDTRTGEPVLQPNADLMYVLTHQERYVDSQRKLWMKICVSIETERKSPMGLCNLGDEARASLVWQIKNFVETYKLDGVALNDKPADYTVEGAAAVDKASYTKFLKELRTALGDGKLIMVSYDADENSALYDIHDGLRAGDYIDWAWWGTANELCTPYATVPSVQPIAGLEVGKFMPFAGDAADTPTYYEWFNPEALVPGQRPPLPKYQSLFELYDAGQCPGVVMMTLRADLQGFYEANFANIQTCCSEIPLRDGSSSSPGWTSRGQYNRDAMKNLPHFSAYGSGLKDW